MATPDDTVPLPMQDDYFRKTMRDKSAFDAQAEKWVALDDQAGSLEQEVKSGENAKERSIGSVWQTEQAMTDARLERDEHRMTDPGSDKKQWEKDYQALDEVAAGYQKDFGNALKNSTPDELEKLQAHIDGKRAELERTIEERQGIAKLPSELAAEGQQTQGQQQDRGQGDEQAAGRGEIRGQGQEVDAPQLHPGELGDRLKQRRADEEQAQAEEGGGRTTEVGHRMRPNYGAYATTVEEHEAGKQHEADRMALWQQLGRAPRDEEMQKFEAERAQARADEAAQGQQQEAPQATQQPAAQQDGQQEDLHAQVLETTSKPLGDRLAARQQRQAEQGQQDQAGQEPQAQAEQGQDSAAGANGFGARLAARQGQGQQQDHTQQQDRGQDAGQVAEPAAAREQGDIWQQGTVRAQAQEEQDRQQGREEEQVQGWAPPVAPNAQQADQQADQGQDAPAPSKAVEEEQGASTVADRKARQAEQAEQQQDKSEAKNEQAQVRVRARDYGEDQGMGM